MEAFLSTQERLDALFTEMAQKRAEAEIQTVKAALEQGYKAVIPGHWCFWPDSRGERATVIFDGSPYYGTADLKYGDTVAIVSTACKREERDGKTIFALKTGIESVWLVDKVPEHSPHADLRYEVVRIFVNEEIATEYYAPSLSR